MSDRTKAGFTLVDLAALVVAVPCVVASVVAGGERTRVSARAQKDSTQLRATLQGMVIFSQSNADSYPIPSRLDSSNKTLPPDTVKDLPRNVISILVYNGSIPAALAVSPGEVNPGITPNVSYEFNAPKLAVDGKLALWDPSFRAYPVDEDGPEKADVPGGLSYAMVPFVGRRRAVWSNTFSSTEVVLGWRGPAYDAADLGGAAPDKTITWKLAPHATSGRTGIGSYRLLFPGAGRVWSGNVAFNDCHVNLLTRPDHESVVFTFTSLPTGQRTRPDNLFVNENDQSRAPDPEDLTGAGGKNVNAYLATWYKGTIERKDDAQALKDLSGGLWWD